VLRGERPELAVRAAEHASGLLAVLRVRPHRAALAGAATATCAASLSVEGVGWSAVPDAAGLQAALKDYRVALP